MWRHYVRTVPLWSLLMLDSQKKIVESVADNENTLIHELGSPDDLGPRFALDYLPNQAKALTPKTSDSLYGFFQGKLTPEEKLCIKLLTHGLLCTFNRAVIF